MMKPIAAPRYQALAETIRARIVSGDYLPGDRLPSEAELCAETGVSRGTAIRAIEQLVAEGIVFRQQGAGTFVARPSMHRRSGHLLSFSQTAVAGGHASQQRLIEIARAPSALAREFGCEPPAMLLRRLRLVDGVACAIHSSVIPMSVARRTPGLTDAGGPGLAISDPDFSLYAAFEAVGLGVEEAEERVTTRLAQSDEAALLGVSLPAAVMVVFRRSFAAGGELIEAVEAVYRSDFYAYDTHLVRGHPDQTRGPKIEKQNAVNPNNRENEA